MYKAPTRQTRYVAFQEKERKKQISDPLREKLLSLDKVLENGAFMKDRVKASLTKEKEALVEKEAWVGFTDETLGASIQEMIQNLGVEEQTAPAAIQNISI